MTIAKSILIVSALLISAGAFAADFNPNYVSSEAEWVMHVNFASGRETLMGEFVLSKMNEGHARVKLDKARERYNIDLRSDFDSMTLYGAYTEDESMVSLIQGSFDQQAIVNAMSKADGYSSKAAGNVVLHSIQRKQEDCGNGAIYTAFTEDGILVSASSEELALEALAVIDGARPNIANNAVLNLANHASGSIMKAAIDVVDSEGIPAKAAMLKRSQNMAFSMREVDNSMVCTTVLTAVDAETALNIDAISRGMLAMMYLKSSEQPELVRIANSIKINTEGNEVRIEMTLPIDELIDLYYESKINVI